MPHVSPNLRVKVLFFAQQQTWPTNNGSRLRNYNLALELAKQFSVTFVQIAPAQTIQATPFADSILADFVSLPKPRPYTPGKISPDHRKPAPTTGRGS